MAKTSSRTITHTDAINMKPFIHNAKHVRRLSEIKLTFQLGFEQSFLILQNICVAQDVGYNLKIQSSEKTCFVILKCI